MEVSVIDLWLPILLSAVAVFVASSVIHMGLSLHRSDYSRLAAEEDVLRGMREAGVKPGDYYFPHAPSMEAMGSDEMQAKYKAGPVGFLTVMPSGGHGMGKSLVQWFLYSLVVSVAVAYVASIGLTRGADSSSVFLFTAVVSALPHATSNVSSSIWKGQSWTTTWKFVLDGAVYGSASAAMFVWWWPDVV